MTPIIIGGVTNVSKATTLKWVKIKHILNIYQTFRLLIFQNSFYL